LLGAITHSCNVFFYKVGLILGAQLIHDYAVKLGFGRPTGIDLPYEEGGFVPSPLWRKIYRAKNWFDGDTANFSIGQGELLVTPIQIARMMAVFANKGKLVTPYVVKEVGGRDISAYQKKITRLSPKENVLDAVREGLRRVVSDPQGTANNLSTLSISVAGKTGTAQAPPGQPHGWFAGFFPFKNPKFVICVFLERGGAGYVASTLARQIIEDMIKEGLI
jgi:penicillin-binding protein 2